MKALTIRQPWATLIAIGAKRIETRSWPTKYRGTVAIHASKGFTRETWRMCREDFPFRQALSEHQIYRRLDLPLGAIVATAEIYTVVRVESIQEEELIPLHGALNRFEKLFGDYEPGRYGWILENVRALKEPIPCKGALGLWNLPAEIEGKVRTA